MGSKVEYVESSHMYATNYIRNSKAIAVLWGIFTICYAIIGVVAFITPEWLGDLEHENPGRFGLWMRCSFAGTGELVEECVGRLDELSSISSVPFRASTILVAIAVLFALLSICAMLLFFFCQTPTVFLVCGWLQVVSAICMGVGVGVYPLGWDSPAVRAICGAAAARYNPGGCAIRWAIPLAGIAALDAATLAALAFILATRHVKLQAEPSFNNGSLYKGEQSYYPDTSRVHATYSSPSPYVHYERYVDLARQRQRAERLKPPPPQSPQRIDYYQPCLDPDQPSIIYSPLNEGWYGEVNPGYVNEAQSVAGSRKSLSMRPVLLVSGPPPPPPEQDRYSELSRGKSHSHHSLFAAGPHPSAMHHHHHTNTLNHSQHNYQL
ncbi:LHFPL tetraspan subfamily member 3 protein [Trichogramma pretiosum]|uniref:LHFPL tetraspan subfamily member 3 protein n=1 Tax=Trichogramma pretiosum TaxID=7493 RepID=UPI0006C94D75|nr:LHFPL tetraspan subfamily member 3 protein [Trichogramma pretiosum]XP_014238894.1 LHFPL tetraspan subfamily member 3 protein [Trichogramma pretiosum]